MNFTVFMDKVEPMIDSVHHLVPDCGPADTVGGEIVRAANRLVYRYLNDGDMVGIEYGNVTCNPACRYLTSCLAIPEIIAKPARKLWPSLYSPDLTEEEYLEALYEIVAAACDYVAKDSRASLPNGIDFSKDYFVRDEDEDCQEDYF